MSESTTDSDGDLLKDVRVLDLSQYIPGPYASLQMVRMGAEVIKVEPPGGDPMRSFGWSEKNISPAYRYLNRGKQIVELDLKSVAGKKKLWQLIQSANVLLEGFRPGRLDRLGFSNVELSKINPQLIVCRITGFGQTGKRAQRAGHDLGYGAHAGLYTRASSKQKPQIIFPPVVDHAGALNALAMISAALFQQAKTAKGCELDIGLSQTVADWQYLPETGSVHHLVSGGAAYYNFYRTKDDRYISLAALEPKFWRTFCEAVGHADWAIRQAEALPQTRLIDEIATLFASRSLAEWQSLLDKVDCCFEPVVGLAQIYQERENPLAPKTAPDQPAPELFILNAEQTSWRDK